MTPLQRNFCKSLIAVVGGNAVYYLLLWPWLPQPARHRAYELDLGLLVDFWVCLALYGAAELLWRRLGPRFMKYR